MIKRVLKSVLILLTLFSAATAYCAGNDGLLDDGRQSEKTDETLSEIHPEQEWGLGVVVRSAYIPFNTEDDRVTSLIPLMFYQGERFFMDGLEGGMNVTRQNNYKIDFLGRLRFFDIPKVYQNLIQEDTVDFGFRFRFEPFDHFHADTEFMTDDRFRWHANIKMSYDFSYQRFDLSPFAILRFKSSRFNDYYFGLDRNQPGSGTDFSLGFRARFHVWRNLYLIGKVQTTWLEQNVRDLEYIDEDRVSEFYLGAAFMTPKDRDKKSSISTTPYVRFSHGWATPSNLGEIISGEFKRDEYHNQLTSIFYGHPLTDELFGLPLDIYLTPGVLWHWKSSVQGSCQEYVLAVKAYYTFKWPVRWRFGAAEGISYATDIPHIESSKLAEKGYEPSNLMNYLDFSLDINMGDITGYRPWEKVYLGYAIHHRSAIFETASHFGRISGGSNYHTFYIQYHF
nr:MipA/OmpV family protein [uncultured Desulfobacter sp.]